MEPIKYNKTGQRPVIFNSSNSTADGGPCYPPPPILPPQRLTLCAGLASLGVRRIDFATRHMQLLSSGISSPRVNPVTTLSSLFTHRPLVPRPASSPYPYFHWYTSFIPPRTCLRRVGTLHKDTIHPKAEQIVDPFSNFHTFPPGKREPVGFFKHCFIVSTHPLQTFLLLFLPVNVSSTRFVFHPLSPNRHNLVPCPSLVRFVSWVFSLSSWPLPSGGISPQLE